MISKEPALRAAIDKMCQEWVNSSPRSVRPDFDALVIYYHRFLEARDFAEWLLVHEFETPQLNVERLLELLLVEHWARSGVYAWQARDR
jgi:hypothetical protein